MIHAHKYGKIENGYQYCEKCGKARHIECNHKWSVIETYKKYAFRGAPRPYSFIYIMQCAVCGDIKKMDVS